MIDRAILRPFLESSAIFAFLKYQILKTFTEKCEQGVFFKTTSKFDNPKNPLQIDYRLFSKIAISLTFLLRMFRFL